MKKEEIKQMSFEELENHIGLMEEVIEILFQEQDDKEIIIRALLDKIKSLKENDQ